MYRFIATIPALALTVACSQDFSDQPMKDGPSTLQPDDGFDGQAGSYAFEIPAQADPVDGATDGGPGEGFDPDPEIGEGGGSDVPSEFPGIPGFEAPMGWQRANLPAGAYWMQYGDVMAQPTADFPIQPGHREVVVAPEIEGYAYLFGTAPILTDLNSLVADGVRVSPFVDGDCELVHTVEADGWHTSDMSFDMHVTETWEMSGKECEDLEKGTPYTEVFEYLASFEWMAPEGP